MQISNKEPCGKRKILEKLNNEFEKRIEEERKRWEKERSDLNAELSRLVKAKVNDKPSGDYGKEKYIIVV